MQINPVHLHNAQPINAPHTQNAAQPAQQTSVAEVDQLDISREAQLVSEARELPGIRTERVAEIRSQIASGAYETDAKLDAALDRLLDEIA